MFRIWQRRSYMSAPLISKGVCSYMSAPFIFKGVCSYMPAPFISKGVCSYMPAPFIFKLLHPKGVYSYFVQQSVKLMVKVTLLNHCILQFSPYYIHFDVPRCVICFTEMNGNYLLRSRVARRCDSSLISLNLLNCKA